MPNHHDRASALQVARRDLTRRLAVGRYRLAPAAARRLAAPAPPAADDSSLLHLLEEVRDVLAAPGTEAGDGMPHARLLLGMIERLVGDAPAR